jgi:hypothetical protein
MTQYPIPYYAIRRLHSLGFKSYAAYLRSPQWEAVKWRYKHSRLPQGCQECGAKQVDLHHRTYKRIGGKEHLSDLVPLCRQHHRSIHRASTPRATESDSEQTRADDKHGPDDGCVVGSSALAEDGSRDMSVDMPGAIGPDQSTARGLRV